MSQIKERPILFSGPMVRAILEGRKTVTRRAIKPQPYIDGSGNFCWNGSNYGQNENGPRSSALASPIPCSKTKRVDCPYGKPGDRLWVRETFNRTNPGGSEGVYYYRADSQFPSAIGGGVFYGDEAWKPSIHMPRAACRILLEITAVRVELLQDITDDQCRAEGCGGGHGSIPGYIYNATPQEHFRHIWRSTGGDYEANPWVWVVEFKRVMP